MHARRLSLLLLVVLAFPACRREQTDTSRQDAAPDPDTAVVAPVRPATTPVIAQAPIADTPRPEAAPVEGNATPIAPPASDTPTPPAAEGARITYTCENGSVLEIAFAGAGARATLADGSVHALVRTATRTGDGERYEDAALQVDRLGNTIEVRERGAAVRRCAETGGNA